MGQQMKDSGFGWIGQVPSHWEVRKLKHFYKMQTGFTPDTKNEEYYDDEGGEDWITIGDLNGSKYIPEQTKSHISRKYIEEYQPQIVPKGSLLYSFKLSVGQVAFADRDVYTNEAIASFIKTDDNCLEYLFYSSYMIVENANENIYGAKILNQDLIRNAYIVYPPVDEQRNIATFLDRECTKVNKIIDKTKESIEEYRRLKQAVITQAVTKGIRQNRDYQESGITWIGQIPSEWDLMPFRHVLKERNEKNSPIKSTERLSLSIDLGVTLYAEKTTNLDRFKDDFEQYKLAHEGDLVMNSMNMIVGASGVSDYYGCVSPVYYTFYDDEVDHITAKFCEYIFRSKTMLRVLFSLGKGIYAIVRGDDRVNTCRLKVAKEDLKNIIIPIPSIEEQHEIVDYLNKKCQEIENLIIKKQSFIEELERYRNDLVFEYVTGKKEVPQS